jgi:SNF2 family DNA or RNA helicase
MGSLGQNANKKSQRKLPLQWERAARLFNIAPNDLPMQHTRPKSNVRFQIVPKFGFASFGWSSQFEMYAHQVVGVSELLEMSSVSNGGMFADVMGLGKTVQIVVLFDINRWL